MDHTKEIKLDICHLYPDLMNMYGDRGNILALSRRCQWRGIETQLHCVSIGDIFDPSTYDIVFFGGGQDQDQETIYQDLMTKKAAGIREAVEGNVVFLCICGGYQLMGQYYSMINGKQIEGIGAVDIRTEGNEKRLIGNIAFESEYLIHDGPMPDEEEKIVIGFENHSGRTYLGEGVKPLGRVLHGHGNNGDDNTEGAVYRNVFCSYSHGSLLPKNYRMTDYLLKAAIERKYNGETAEEAIDFRRIDNCIEDRARRSMLKKIKYTV